MLDRFRRKILAQGDLDHQAQVILGNRPREAGDRVQDPLRFGLVLGFAHARAFRATKNTALETFWGFKRGVPRQIGSVVAGYTIRLGGHVTNAPMLNLGIARLLVAVTGIEPVNLSL